MAARLAAVRSSLPGRPGSGHRAVLVRASLDREVPRLQPSAVRAAWDGRGRAAVRRVRDGAGRAGSCAGGRGSRGPRSRGRGARTRPQRKRRGVFERARAPHASIWPGHSRPGRRCAAVGVDRNHRAPTGPKEITRPVRLPWGLYPHGSNNTNNRGSAAAGTAPSARSGRLVSQRQDELGLRGREDRPLALPSGRTAHPLHAPDARRMAR